MPYSKGTDMKKMVILYPLMILMHYSMAMEPGTIVIVKKRPGYITQNSSEKVTFMGLIRRLLPKKQEQHDDSDTIKVSTKKDKKSSCSSSVSMFDLQPIDMDEIRVLTDEGRINEAHYYADINGLR